MCACDFQNPCGCLAVDELQVVKLSKLRESLGGQGGVDGIRQTDIYRLIPGLS